MKKSTQIAIGIIATLALVIGIVGLVGGNHQTASLGGTSNYDTISVNGLKVGVGCNDAFSSSCTGTSISNIITGTCDLVGQANVDTIVATGIATSSCAVTGALTTDKVFVSLNNASSTIGAVPVVVKAAYASTTAGAITVILYNATSSATQVTKTGSSTQYWIIR